MKRFGWITALVLVCTVNAVAQPTETLVVPPYPADVAWKQIMDQRAAGAMHMREWIPADQTENDIRDILVQQNAYALKSLTPSIFVISQFRTLISACEGLKVNGPTERIEGDYTVAYSQMYCTNQKGAAKDVDIFVKAIGGKDALYVVQREFRRPATPGAKPGVRSFSGDQADAAKAAMEAQASASSYLRRVRLCPSAEPENTRFFMAKAAIVTMFVGEQLTRAFLM